MAKIVSYGIFLQCLLVGVLLANNGNAQDQKSIYDIQISLKVSKEPLFEVFRKIERKTHLKFTYNDSKINLNKRIEIHVNYDNLANVLEELSKLAEIKFKRINKNIHVSPIKRNEKPIEEVYMKVTQTRNITGKVTSFDEGDGLPGVNVIEKGTSNGTVTDVQGHYSISVSADATVVFSSVGYTTEEVEVDNRSAIDISMTPDIQQLQELVVVGYGTQKKSDLTGAISQVRGEDIQKMALVGLDQAIQGRAAGVQVTQNSGEPGGDISVRIRGVGSINNSSEPLYIIDGVPTEGGLNAISINDVESIDILKDASSAAIYGARAANGVVIVTTKRGKTGTLKAELNAYYGFSSREKKLDLANTSQFVELTNEAFINTQNDPRYNDTPGPNPRWSNPSDLPNTDWQDLIFRTAPIQNYNLSISGGSENLRSSFSLGYFNQEGIILESGFERYTMRVTTDYEATQRLRFGGNFNVSYSDKQQNVIPGLPGPVEQAYMAQPVLAPYTDQVGEYDDVLFGYKGYNFYNFQASEGFAYNSNILGNPIYYLKDNNNNWTKDWGIIGGVYGEYDVIKDLKFRTALNINRSEPRSWYYVEAVPPQVAVTLAKSSLSTNTSTNFMWNWINTVNYQKTFGKHNLEILLGTDAIKENWYSIGASARVFPSEQNVAINAGAEVNPGTGSEGGESRMSYLGRINYNYEDKYLLTLNLRRDGSSKFGPDYKWGTFPSAAFGWRASEESFLNKFNWLSNLKLRLSWGIVGNDRIANYQYLSTFGNADREYRWGFQPISTVFGPPGSEYLVYGYELKNMANEGIRWEESHQYDAGLEIGLLNRLNLSVDYYVKDIQDMLGFEPVPITFGAPGNSRFYNFASMKNSGFEFDVSYFNKIGDFTYDINANFSTLKNEVKDVGLSDDIIFAGMATQNNNLTTRTEIGKPIAYYYGLKTDGIFQSQEEIDNAPTHPSVVPGDRRFKDMNNDGLIDMDDRVDLGNGLPKYLFGFNFNAGYKNFDFNAFLQGQAGVKIANSNIYHAYNIRYFNGTFVQNVAQKVYEERWTGPGTSNTMPRVAYQPSASNLWFSDEYIEDGSFLRIKNVQLGYSIPDYVINRIGLDKLRIFVSGQNLFTITKYSGLDPEIGSRDQNVLSTGIDSGRYPLSKTFLLGLNVTF